MNDFLQFVDRVPTLPNRKKITHADSSVEYATIEYADEPVETGTPLNRANLQKLVGPMGYSTIDNYEEILGAPFVDITSEESSSSNTNVTITNNSMVASNFIKGDDYYIINGFLYFITFDIDNNGNVTAAYINKKNTSTGLITKYKLSNGGSYCSQLWLVEDRYLVFWTWNNSCTFHSFDITTNSFLTSRAGMSNYWCFGIYKFGENWYWAGYSGNNNRFLLYKYEPSTNTPTNQETSYSGFNGFVQYTIQLGENRLLVWDNTYINLIEYNGSSISAYSTNNMSNNWYLWDYEDKVFMHNMSDHNFYYIKKENITSNEVTNKFPNKILIGNKQTLTNGNSKSKIIGVNNGMPVIVYSNPVGSGTSTYVYDLYDDKLTTLKTFNVSHSYVLLVIIGDELHIGDTHSQYYSGYKYKYTIGKIVDYLLTLNGIDLVHNIEAKIQIKDNYLAGNQSTNYLNDKLIDSVLESNKRYHLVYDLPTDKWIAEEVYI